MEKYCRCMTVWVLLLLAVIAMPLSAQPCLFDNHHSDYKILLPTAPTAVERQAAELLQACLFQISGAQLPIVAENSLQPTDTLVLSVGKTQRSTRLARTSELRDDGYLLFSNQRQLFCFGNAGKSVLHAVTGFLEHYLDCRMYAPDARILPTRNRFALPPIDRIENPSFAYREVLYYYPNQSQAYADWHALHNRQDMEAEWGMFVHTFRHLIPVEHYFEKHPEWFSEINGKRVKDGQLCLSNPELLDELYRNLALMMAEKPSARIWSVSNNDNVNNCTCSHCRHLDSLYGAPSGTLLHFINQVAARFPDKTISTLAYQYTRHAPTRNIAPADNVNIMFCSIECGRQEPIATAPGEAAFRQDMLDWSRLTHNIFVWDYVVQFRNMLNPFPNLHVLQPNLRFFHDHGVRLMFEQGTGARNKTSWMELRTYLLAKLIWNVDADVDSLTTDFCSGYYGAAAEPMQTFFSEMQQSLVASGRRLDIYGYPINGKDGYLSPAQIRKYQQLLADAYQKAGDDKQLRDRIRYVEISLDFAILELSMSEVSPELSFFTEQNGRRVLNEAMVQRADRFVEDCRYFGVHNLEEMGYTPEEFRENIDNFIRKATEPNLAFRKPVRVAGWSEHYDAGGATALTDGICGILNYNYNWLGFHGSDMDAVVDLEKKQYVNEISIDFYFYPLSWIYAPQCVEFLLSNDGRHWKRVGEVLYANPEILAKPHIQNFSVRNLRRKARYVRVVAHSLHTNPEWHRGVGEPCWIFTDELRVR